ncbi:2Fe-2S iron-sulfur cluster-binding protein [Parvibaculum sp.]|jgi:ferredoxin, 2Fe-2S|uniref:2Fe-2S iron-sulfur cluster-binding protein n=1 Tax=Parvibaculum sp. TaxID=2024848 RepID=UPI001B1D006C|nr:2Fe-2S iron-sulfur cluster-binding protein [Parvibaculum sp.]MBO6634568.1 2Fe-2S iron-sulfur cluster binding domain-containing protein [Parvibaculum sp.]MBO6679504.1 2Fe-2S iron-sulfur cluster binding domain-containing protein [Parvibaculum sp.]MBO6684913.1 2Fe-2S iron-sulfur cluster binding domain-containing protein [Parvibaculum sp.]MBO6904278.1 2Fe-2S iron-sulfur cluster binding domain-containing protein [Parvibaculum sp.]
MLHIKYVEANGTEYLVETDAGFNAMEVAVKNGIPGIDGDCGGAAACATCHVYVDPGWIEKTGKAAEGLEQSMLEFAEDVQDNSRLACQIKLDDALDGLVLKLPEKQH